jgi:hypothetical protein
MAHRHHSLSLRAACAALALATVAAACSSDDDSVGDATSVPITAAAATTTSRPSTSVGSTTSDAPTTTSTDPTSSAPETTAEASTTSEAVTTTTEPVPVYPLTGVPDPDPTIAARKVLVVKIGNEPAARPQTGFNAADIVVEEIVNDNLTRFAMVFHSGDSNPVGPVRSGRIQDIDLFGSFSAPLFAWSGGNPAVTRAIDASDLINIGPNHANVYFRSNQRKAPSNLYSNTEALREFSPFGAPPPPQQFQYRDPAARPQGEPSLGVDVTLDAVDVNWTWNPDEGLYFRRMDGRAHDDAGSGQVTTNNVVVLEMQYARGISNSPDAQSVGSGEAFVFTGGHYIHGYWERFDRTEPFQLYTDDNEPILLSQGRTFIELPRDESTTALGSF